MHSLRIDRRGTVDAMQNETPGFRPVRRRNSVLDGARMERAGGLCANDSRSSGIAAPQPPSLPSNKWSAMEATAHHRGATGASLNTGGGPPRLDRWIVAKKGLACGS